MSILLFQWCALQLFQRTAQLVRTRGALCAASQAVEPLDDVVYLLSAHQLADTLQVAIAPSEEEHLLNDVMLVGRYVDEL